MRLTHATTRFLLIRWYTPAIGLEVIIDFLTKMLQLRDNSLFQCLLEGDESSFKTRKVVLELFCVIG